MTTFIGYDYNDSQEQRAHGQPWKVLFGGANGINYFGLVHGGQTCGIFRPDFSPTKNADWFFPEIQELKAGVGRLFMQGDLEDDGIAILYSPASVHSATAAGLADLSHKKANYGVNLTNLGKLLSESHYQYRFVHEDQLKEGELSKFKVLFLSWNSSLSTAEAEAIREFVKAGGTLIADSFAGVRDGHGKPENMLEEVLGVRQPLDPPSLHSGTLEVTDEQFSGPKKVFVTTGVSQLELKGAKARALVGEQPAFLVHPYGKGQAIFLNASFSNYSYEVSGGEGGEVSEGEDASQNITAPIREFVTALLTEAGVPVPLSVKTGEKENSEIELSRFKLGDARLLGVMRAINGEALNPEDKEEVTLTLEQPWHVYDIREGKYLGQKEVISTSLLRATAKAYALLPYEVRTVTLNGPKSATPGSAAEFVVEVSADQPCGTHVFHLTAKGPDGKERPLYAQNLVAPQGKGEATIPFAWNDPEGEWTVTVRDVVTGTSQQRSILLKK